MAPMQNGRGVRFVDKKCEKGVRFVVVFRFVIGKGVKIHVRFVVE